MITMEQVYNNGIDYLINKNNDKKLENECIKRQIENKPWYIKFVEYVKEII